VLVYRNQSRRTRASSTLRALRRRIHALGNRPVHDDVVDVLIELGMLESAVSDALHPNRDDDDGLSRRFRAAARAAAHLVAVSWRRNRPADMGAWRLALAAALEGISEAELPPEIHVALPEGYAQYAVYPETYLEAARQCAATMRPRQAVCLGLRSIGTSLSAVVAAELESRGVAVASYTLRPRGHPYDRRIEMTGRLRAALCARRESLFLIVDEGPGISGSSMASAAAALTALGIPDQRIVLLPSCSTDGAGLRSAAARDRWRRHRQFTASFEDVWLASGRLLSAEAPTSVVDLSAGAWRGVFLHTDSVPPAVQPQHERRKLLADGRLLSFAGLAGRARDRLARAEILAAAGFGPPALGETHGFLVRPVSGGEPLTQGEPDEGLLDCIARYLAFLRRRFPDEPSSELELTSMVDINVREALGHEGEQMLAAHRRKWGAPVPDSPTALDGRMLPHEWLRTGTGFLKVDALDHHDDHFFPGRQDIAWDLAAACVEFPMTRAAREYLVGRYRDESGDRTIQARLPPYAVAYLAFRTGYSTLAAESLGASSDGGRFARLADRYSARLRQELTRG
jgi:hypothetical protein